MKYINVKTGIISEDKKMGADWMPISEERVQSILQLMKDVFIEAAKKQAAGYKDDWRQMDFGELYYSLREEITEVDDELCAFEDPKYEPGAKNLDYARMEVAHAALVLAFIHDKLNAIELESMHENRAENNA